MHRIRPRDSQYLKPRPLFSASWPPIGGKLRRAPPPAKLGPIEVRIDENFVDDALGGGTEGLKWRAGAGAGRSGAGAARGETLLVDVWIVFPPSLPRFLLLLGILTMPLRAGELC